MWCMEQGWVVGVELQTRFFSCTEKSSKGAKHRLQTEWQSHPEKQRKEKEKDKREDVGA